MHRHSLFNRFTKWGVLTVAGVLFFASLALVPPDWVAPPSDTNLGFLVADVDVATAELASRGLEPAGELTTSGELRYRHFRAADGRLFELLDRRG